MTMLKVTSKGQITLRKEVLRHLGIAPGQKVDVALLPNRSIAIRPVAGAGASLDRFFSVLDGRAPRSITLDEMDRASQDGWVGEAV